MARKWRKPDSAQAVWLQCPCDLQPTCSSQLGPLLQMQIPSLPQPSWARGGAQEPVFPASALVILMCTKVWGPRFSVWRRTGKLYQGQATAPEVQPPGPQSMNPSCRPSPSALKPSLAAHQEGLLAAKLSHP